MSQRLKLTIVIAYDLILPDKHSIAQHVRNSPTHKLQSITQHAMLRFQIVEETGDDHNEHFSH